MLQEHTKKLIFETEIVVLFNFTSSEKCSVKCQFSILLQQLENEKSEKHIWRYTMVEKYYNVA